MRGQHGTINIKYAHGTGRNSTGIWGLYFRKPVPMRRLEDQPTNGEVKIIKPADPEKVKKYREEVANMKKGHK